MPGQRTLLGGGSPRPGQPDGAPQPPPPLCPRHPRVFCELQENELLPNKTGPGTECLGGSPVAGRHGLASPVPWTCLWTPKETREAELGPPGSWGALEWAPSFLPCSPSPSRALQCSAGLRNPQEGSRTFQGHRPAPPPIIVSSSFSWSCRFPHPHPPKKRPTATRRERASRPAGQDQEPHSPPHRHRPPILQREQNSDCRARPQSPLTPQPIPRGLGGLAPLRYLLWPRGPKHCPAERLWAQGWPCPPMDMPGQLPPLRHSGCGVLP